MVFDPKRQLGGVPKNVNEEFFDAMVRHQIGLLRFSGSVRKQVLAVLDATEKDLADQIRRRMRNVSGFDSPASVRRLDALLKTVATIRQRAWKQAREIWFEQMQELARSEPEFVASAIRTVSPVQLNLAIPAPLQLAAIVTKQPFEGKVLRQWARDIERADIDRIQNAIRIGLTQGEAPRQIARRVVGTVRQRGVNGVTEITRRGAQAITRTAVNAIANQAKRAFVKANLDIIKEELYVATLDSRTTPICRSLDGQIFPEGEGPIPPLHFSCRSLRLPIIDGEVLGTRPMRNFTRRQLLREYASRNNFRAPVRRRDLPRGHKGRFDDFARTRIRELTGTVDAKVSYQEWLGRQPASFQNDVLGRTKGLLFRKGNLTLDRFVEQSGRELTLSELAGREASAFRAAGLDPENFQ